MKPFYCTIHGPRGGITMHRDSSKDFKIKKSIDGLVFLSGVFMDVIKLEFLVYKKYIKDLTNDELMSFFNLEVDDTFCFCDICFQNISGVEYDPLIFDSVVV